LTGRLLSLVRRYRGKTSAIQERSAPDLLMNLVSSLTVVDDTPEDGIAMARTFAVWLRPGPDCSGAVDLLRDANVGEFDLDDLNELRLEPAFAHIKELLAATGCKENDHPTNEKLYNCIRALAMEVGRLAPV
jgi:hypothetical protein